MGDIIKSGYIKRYSKSFLNGGWNKSFLQLHRDSTLRVYKKQGDSTCQGYIYMKDVCKYFAYGEFTAGMPDRPEPPSGATYDCIMGVPQKPHRDAKIHWFLFSNTDELHSWMKAICSVLPPPPQSQSHQPQHQPSSSSAAPPPYTQQQHPQQQYFAPPVASAPPPPPTSHYGPPPVGPGYGPPPPAAYPPPPPPPPGSGPGQSLGFENLSLGGPAAGVAPYPAQPYPAVPQPYGPPQPVAGYYAPQYPQAQPYAPQQPPPTAYPQQHYQHPPGYAGYPQQAVTVSYPYHHQQQYQPQVVYQHKKKKGGGVLGSNTGQIAAGVAGGALLGYGASRMMGGGWGLGRWGSWSSMSSFGSFGSCGSFGSFGSFG